MRKKILFGALLVVSILLFGTSSAIADTVTVQQLQPVKLSHVRSDDSSFSALGDRGNAHVMVIVKREGLRDKDFQRDPDIDSPYNNDVIIYNRHGYPMATNNANTIPAVDLATGSVLNAQSLQAFGAPSGNQAEQIEDLQSTLDAIKSLRQDKNISEKFRWELRTAQGLAQWSLDHANDQINGLVKPQPTPDIKEALSKMNGYVSQIGLNWATAAPTAIFQPTMAAASVSYNYTTYIRYKGIVDPHLAQHSGVLLNVYNANTGAFVSTVSTANHGTEASDPSMMNASGCPKAWTGRSTANPVFQPFISTDTYGTGDAGGCASSYGFFSGQHVCNDDSLAEYWNLKYNTQASWATCNDASLRNYAPSCD